MSKIKRTVHVVKASPTKKIVNNEIVEEVDTDDLIGELSTEKDIADAARLEDLRERFGGHQYTIRVEKFNKTESRFETVDKFQFDTFDEFAISRKWGGGEYVCQLLDEDAKYVKGGRFRFIFAEPKELDKPVGYASPLQDPTTQAFIEQMKSNQSMLLEVLKTSLTGEKQTPIEQIVNALKGLKDMSGEKNDMFKNMRDMLEMQMLMKEATGQDDDKGGGTGVVSEILEAFKTLKSIPPRPQTGQRNAGVSSLPIVKNPNSDVKESDVIPPVKSILFYVPKFTEAAERNDDPEKWADFLLNILETETVPALVKHYWLADEQMIWEKLIAASEDPDKIEKLFEKAPTLSPFKEWVVAVINCAIKQLDAQSPAENGNGTAPAE